MLLARADAALEVLRQRPEVDAARIGGIGFCFGGSTVLQLARTGADLKGVVSFHGALSTKAPAKAGSVKAGILSCTGADDPGSRPIKSSPSRRRCAPPRPTGRSFRMATPCTASPTPRLRIAQPGDPLYWRIGIECSTTLIVVLHPSWMLAEFRLEFFETIEPYDERNVMACQSP
jgi:Dienelactone hydrolase family